MHYQRFLDSIGTKNRREYSMGISVERHSIDQTQRSMLCMMQDQSTLYLAMTHLVVCNSIHLQLALTQVICFICADCPYVYSLKVLFKGTICLLACSLLLSHSRIQQNLRFERILECRSSQSVSMDPRRCCFQRQRKKGQRPSSLP